MGEGIHSRSYSEWIGLELRFGGLWSPASFLRINNHDNKSFSPSSTLSILPRDEKGWKRLRRDSPAPPPLGTRKPVPNTCPPTWGGRDPAEGPPPPKPSRPPENPHAVPTLYPQAVDLYPLVVPLARGRGRSYRRLSPIPSGLARPGAAAEDRPPSCPGVSALRAPLGSNYPVPVNDSSAELLYPGRTISLHLSLLLGRWKEADHSRAG